MTPRLRPTPKLLRGMQIYRMAFVLLFGITHFNLQSFFGFSNTGISPLPCPLLNQIDLNENCRKLIAITTPMQVISIGLTKNKCSHLEKLFNWIMSKAKAHIYFCYIIISSHTYFHKTDFKQPLSSLYWIPKFTAVRIQHYYNADYKFQAVRFQKAINIFDTIKCIL